MEESIKNYRIYIKDIENYYIDLECEESADGIRKYYTAKPQLKNGTEIGYMNFYKNKSEIWLNKIEINEEYRGKGVGGVMLSLLEYITLLNRTNNIEGKYFPSVDYAKYFYEKNGYTIEKDGYETIVYKYIYEDKLSELEKKFNVKEMESKDNELSL